ncbi:MAG: AmmeMemoRadiSam system protein B [Chloroflexi bacterium]|nr:AmmeMemoRadiSam system protein B [Chloroflexota bacterium]
MKIIYSLFFAAILLILVAFGCNAKPAATASVSPEKTPERSTNVKRSYAAGGFFPANQVELRMMVEKYLKDAKPPEVDEPIVAVVSPHAGYPFSGPLAAYDFKLFEGKQIKTVYILGINHRAGFDGISVYTGGAYGTPLGAAKVDEEAAAKLLKASPRFMDLPQAHENEHSLEVMVPFIQVVLPDAKIVPIVFSWPNLEDCKIAAKALAEQFVPGETVVVASSDMSHDHLYKEAVSMDKGTLELMKNLDVEGLAARLQSGKGELCGAGPVLTAMFLAKELGAHGTILGYTTSGDVVGDTRSRIVGYGAVAFSGMKKTSEKKNDEEERITAAGKDADTLTGQEKKAMLSIARQTLDEFIKEGNVPKIDFKKLNMPVLEERRGLFVTLHKGKNKDLRGCIGYIEAIKPVGEAIQDMAVNASTKDPRFRPVSPGELKDIKIEISLLSPLKRITNPDDIIPFKNGVVVKQGWHQGLFLPQVWEQIPDKNTFMEHLCAGKAGLAPDAWKDKKTELYVFTVEHFEEEH